MILGYFFNQNACQTASKSQQNYKQIFERDISEQSTVNTSNKGLIKCLTKESNKGLFGNDSAENQPLIFYFSTDHK